MAEDKAFRDALNEFLYRLHVGANSGSQRQMDAWRQMGYDLPVAEVTGSQVAKPAVETPAEAAVEAATTEISTTPEIKAEAVETQDVRKSLIAATQARPTQWWEGESKASADPKTLAKAYEYLVRSTQAQSTLKKD